MEIKGEFKVKASTAKVWDSIWDPDLMQAWLPGCKRAAWEDDRHVKGEMEQSVAQLKATFAFDMQVVEIQEFKLIRLSGVGEGLTINSSLILEVELSLESLNSETTHIRYLMKTEIMGALAKIGNFVLRLKAKTLKAQMAQGVISRLEGGKGAA